MAVIAVLADRLSKAMRDGGEAAGAAALRALVSEYAGRLRPMHPTRQTGELSHYFVVENPRRGSDDQLAEALRHVEGIDGAYAKPDAELP